MSLVIDKKMVRDEMANDLDRIITAAKTLLFHAEIAKEYGDFTSKEIRALYRAAMLTRKEELDEVSDTIKGMFE